MSDARRCDICGEFFDVGFDSVNVTSIAVIAYFNKNLEPEDVDCCPDCWKSIKDHIDILKHRKKEK